MAIKISQDELRKFMKQKRENQQSNKIDSPFAKYSSSGQLSCTICNITIKSNNLWVSHVVGKVHKENLVKGKKSSNENSSKNISAVGIKRPSEQADATKKLKTEVFKVPQEPQKPKSTPATSLLAGYSSSDDESDDNDEIESKAKLVPDNASNSLPTDFFDSTPSNGPSESSSKSIEEKESTSATPSKKEALPEGFFDDPILDAKARNIEYKDPVEEEWERFQKSIAEETNVSKSIMEEDLEESIIERGIHQIDEQIHQWERKIGLESLADNVKLKVTMKEGDENESGTTDDDLDEDDLLDWRSKSIKKA